MKERKINGNNWVTFGEINKMSFTTIAIFEVKILGKRRTNRKRIKNYIYVQNKFEFLGPKTTVSEDIISFIYTS